MFDAVADEDRVATNIFDMLLHLRNRWSIFEPLLADAMDAIEAVSDADLWVDERINQDAAMFIHDANLAHSTLIVALVHLAVDCHKQGHVSLLWFI